MRTEVASRVPFLLAAWLLGCAIHSPTDDLRDLARTHAEAGRQAEARLAIEEAVRLAPDDVRLRREAARIAGDGGDADLALAHLELALGHAPNDASLWIHMAELERERENFADAYVAYRRASELAPKDLRAVSGLALVADQLGFEEEAREAYARWNELTRAAEERREERAE